MVPHTVTSRAEEQCSATGPTIVAIVCLLAGAVAGWGVEFAVGAVATALLAIAYGVLVGELVRRLAAAGCRNAGVLVCAALLVGAVGARLSVAAYLLFRATGVHPPLGALYVVADLVSPSPVPALGLVGVVVGAIARMRMRVRH